jgi:type II secretory pathway component GspD/PulD (secretin)
MTHKQHWARRGLFLSLLVTLAVAGSELRAQPPKGPGGDPKGKTFGPAPDPKVLAEKRVKFEMRNEPWSKVLEWLSDQTGLAFSGVYPPPTGSYTFIAPGGQKFTIPEVIDYINRGLLERKYILIRRERQFSLVPADEKINPDWVPLISQKDLDKYGQTEVVRMLVQLKEEVAEELAPQIKKMMGPLAEAVAIPGPNRIALQDTAGNLRAILPFILRDETGKTVDAAGKPLQEQANSFIHKCKYMRASEAAARLKDILGDPRKIIEAQAPTATAPAFPRKGEAAAAPPTPAPTSAAAAAAIKIKMHYVSYDDKTNTVMVSGPPDKIILAKMVIQSLDVPVTTGQKERLPGEPLIKNYTVPDGNAEVIAKALNEYPAYKTLTNVRIGAISPTTIMVYAPIDDHFEIAKLIEAATTRPTSANVLIPLNTVDSKTLADMLIMMFGDAKGGAPFIQSDPLRNSIFISGTADQVQKVKEAIRVYTGEGDGFSNSATMRILSLEKGSAATLAKAIQQTMQELRQNPIKVVIPGSEAAPPPKPRPPQMPSIDDDSHEEQDEPPTLPLKAPEPKTSPKEEQPKVKLPGSPEAPITIMATGNRLVIQSKDTKALDQVQELIRLYTRSYSLDSGDFEVLKLKHASAVEVAKVLDAAFNGTKTDQQQQQQQQLQPFNFPQFGGGAGAGGAGAAARAGGRIAAAAANAAAAKERIRVVADTATNSLLVKASPLDMLTIRGLLTRIDTTETESEAVTRTWFIGPLKNTTAVEVARVLEGAYRDSMASTQAQLVGGFPGFGFFGFGARAQGGAALGGIDPATGRPRGATPKLAIGVDDRTNTLVAVCSKPMYDDVKRLVDHLEKAAGDNPQTVVVSTVEGVDPQLVEQLVEAVMGTRQTGTRTTTPGMTGRPGTAGGFNPFGQQPGGGLRPFGQGGGGIQPGGGARPGGGGGGGGGGRQGGGGGGRQGGGGESRGPSFFDYRVKDDPQLTHAFFDPQADNLAADELQETEQPVSLPADSIKGIAGPLMPVSFQEQKEQGKEGEAKEGEIPFKQERVQAPRLPVTIESIPSLGIVVIRGQNPADVRAVQEIIKRIVENAKTGEPVILLVPVLRGDAISITNTLNQLFSRVNVSADFLAFTGAGAPAPTPRAITTGQPAVAVAAGPTGGTGSVVLLAVPRQNAILVVAPKKKLDYVVNKIKELDVPGPPQTRVTPFPLRRAAASRVANLLISFYAQRYPEQNQVHITFDDTTNTVLVTASPDDLKEISDLLSRIDTAPPRPKLDLRIVRLSHAVSDTLAAILEVAIAEGFTPVTAVQSQVGIARPVGVTGQAAAPTAVRAAPVNVTPTVKTNSVRFVTKDGKIFETGVVEDIRITSDARTNSLIITAPEQTMPLILQLVRDLDVAPQATAEVHVHTLKKLDASIASSMLQQLFLGTGTLPTGAGGPGAAPKPAAAAAALAAQPLTITIPGIAAEPGAPIIPVRVTIEPKTNSLIVVGSENDQRIIDAVIQRLEDADVQGRQYQVYQLKNALAPDVASALNTFLQQEYAYWSPTGYWTGFEQLQQEVTLVAEPVTNKLLISATPRFYDKVMRFIIELDLLPPQVMVAALVAEVDLTGTEEFGVELGLQAPVLFQRSVLASGTVANTTTFDAAVPGFNFNNVNLPLGQATLASPPVIGTQGLTNLGVGRISPTTGVGGFVFQAASQSVNILVRALRTQGRIDILSRPELMTADNQQAVILVGQSFPYVTGSTTVTTTAFPTTINTVAYRDTGVQLQVTPKINPDGSVVMRVIPQISEPVTSTTQVTGGPSPIFATAFNVQTVETTVIAQDGETVVIGGMISKIDTKQENKLPYLGDLPGIGALFRYRTEIKSKKELLVILTPHIVRGRADADRILAEESRRMDWILGDVLKIHGTHGMEPVMPVPPKAPPGFGPGMPLPGPGGFVPGWQGPAFGPELPAVPGPDGLAPGGPEVLPVPQVLPPSSAAAPPGTPLGGAGPGQPIVEMVPGCCPTTDPLVPGQVIPLGPAPDAGPASATSVPQGRESRRWRLLPFLHHDNGPRQPAAADAPGPG